MKRKSIICRRCESCGRLGDVERAAVFVDQLEANVVRWRDGGQDSEERGGEGKTPVGNRLGDHTDSSPSRGGCPPSVSSSSLGVAGTGGRKTILVEALSNVQ